MKLDLRLENDIAQAFAAAVDAFGDIDVLVNNAGRTLVKPAIEVTWAEWDDVVDTDLKGAYFMARTYAAHCIARGRPGCVVNIASTHGMTGFAGRTVYGTAKGGLIQMTRMLAIEWIGHNIRVNSIAPATVLTPSRAKMYDDADARAHARAHSDRPLHHAGGSRRRRRFPRQPRRGLDHRPDAGGGRRVYGELAASNDCAGLACNAPMPGRRLRQGPSRR